MEGGEMGRTILCPHCKSTFDEKILAKRSEPNICPVCGENLCGEDSDTSEHNEEIDLEHPDMYFYDIEDEEDEEDEELREVWCNCTNCRKINTIPYNNFSVINSKYLKLKDGVEICCKGCGKAVTNPIIPKRPDGWRELNMWEKDYVNLPKCPTCSSTNIKKITVTSKVASVAMWGVLSRKVHKQWHCNICGSEVSGR